jgi:zinc dependent phospholipase C
MPGPFTHIYTQRRVADFLAQAAEEGGVSEAFVRTGDDNLLGPQNLDPSVLKGLTPGECAKIMMDWPKFAALGAVGPDLFFFLEDYAQPQIPSDELMLALSLLYWLDDQGRLDDPWEGLLAIIGDITGNGFVAVLRFLIKLSKLWQTFLDGLQDLVAPILDAAGQLLDDLTGGLLSELGDLFTQLKNDLMVLVAEEALSWQDVFAFFSLKMRHGFDEQSFVWSDMTHYRLTSYVPRELLAHARKMEEGSALDREHAAQLKAYALGWITHVATDTVAHSYVNEQAGGPFRTHWQRHHLVENHMDAFNYQCTGDGMLPPDPKVGSIEGYEGFNHSALFFAVQIPQDIDSPPNKPKDKKEGDWRPQPLPEADSRVHRKEREKLLDTDGAMPNWLAETIVRVFIEVYAKPEDGGLPNAEYVSERGPHPLNLMGMPFQDALGDGSGLLGKWLSVLGIGDPEMAFVDLLAAVAPMPPADLKVPKGFPLPWEVQTAYRFMLSWFKREFNTGFDMDKPKRPTWFTPPASDFNFGPPDFSGVNPSDNPISQLCEAILAFLDWAVKSLEKAAQLAYDLGKSAISGATLPARQALYEGLVLPAWQVCENMREVLVHLAYLTPQSEMRYADTGEIRRPNEIDYELISLGHSVDSAFAAALAAAFDPLGNLDKDPTLTAPADRNPKGGPNHAFPWLPVRPTKTFATQATSSGSFPFYSDVVEFQRPWAFPDKTNDPDPMKAGNYVETPQTIPGPYPRDAMPTILFEQNGPASNGLRYDYEMSNCPEETDRLNLKNIGGAPFTNGYPVPEGTAPEDISGTNPLGDPIIFSSYLIGQIAGNPNFRSNFNLDADRGFGYLCWDWIRDREKGHEAKDARGNKYPPPVTTPEGTSPNADNNYATWPYPDPTAAGQDPPPLYPSELKLEYPGRKCDERGPVGPRPRGNPR